MSGNVRLTLAGAVATVLASMALLSAFRQGQDWLWPSMTAVALIAGGGVGLRALGVPRLLVPVAQLVALFWGLLLLYAPSGTRWAFFPSSDSVRDLAAEIELGIEVITRYAAPVPSGPEIGLITTIGVALVALVVDALAATSRLVPWAGLPLLLLYSVPATTVDGSLTALAFIPAAVGYLLLLFTEGRIRLSGWGRSVGVPDSRSSEIAASMFGSTGRRVGATVVCLAVLVPALLPALPDGVLPEPSGSAGQGGPSDHVLQVDNPMVDLRRDLRMPENFTVMTYTTSAEDNGYIRLLTLDKFDGKAWRPSNSTQPMPSDDRLPAPRGLDASVPREVETARFRISDGLRSQWLPLFYPPRRVDAPGDWSYSSRSLEVRARNGSTSTAGIEYRTTYVVPEHSGRDLRQAPEPPGDIVQRYTRLPDGLPERLINRAEQLTADDRTDYDAAVTLQDWFRSEFTYSLETVPGHSQSHLVDFLNDKRGYCEQFAATMAIMARSLGIPARVAVGYQPGTPMGDDFYQVRVKDAHAWPELYFAGHGWVRFEPTPVQQTGSPPEWTSLPGQDQPSEPTPTPTPSEDQSTPQPETTSPSPEADSQTPDPAAAADGGGDGGGPLLDPRPFLIGLGALALLAAPGISRASVRRARLGRPPETRAEACWVELADSAWDLGVRWPRAETPRGVGQQLADRLSEPGGEALGVLMEAVERDRYAPEPGRLADVAGATRRVIGELRSRASRSRRMAATVIPMTVLRWLGAVPRAAAWPWGAAERLGARVTRALRSRRAL